MDRQADVAKRTLEKARQEAEARQRAEQARREREEREWKIRAERAKGAAKRGAAADTQRKVTDAYSLATEYGRKKK